MDEFLDKFFQENGGDEYKSVEQMIKDHPKCITVNGCCKSYDDSYALFYFKEESGVVFPAQSGDLKKLWERLVEECGGDESKVNNYLKESPKQFRIEKVPMKNSKNRYVKILRAITD